MMGPKVGPFSGPIDQMENPRARYFSVVISPTVPGELATMTLPARAPIKRTRMISIKDFAKPHGIIKTVKMNMLITYTGRRPYISERGARNIEPTARPRTGGERAILR